MVFCMVIKISNLLLCNGINIRFVFSYNWFGLFRLWLIYIKIYWDYFGVSGEWLWLFFLFGYNRDIKGGYLRIYFGFFKWLRYEDVR